MAISSVSQGVASAPVAPKAAQAPAAQTATAARNDRDSDDGGAQVSATAEAPSKAAAVTGVGQLVDVQA